MLLRRVVATAVVVVATAVCGLAGCDDGQPASTVGNPEATTTEPQSSSPYPTYVALGDSYTAAPGVPQTDLTTGCARSDGNYPALLASALDTEVVDVSCSGASTLDLVGAQQTGGKVVPAQFDALTPDTSLVTLGIGGNDLQLFRTLVGTCAQLGSSQPDGAPCHDQMAAAGARDPLVRKIGRIRARVTAAIRGVHDRSPDATVVLVGYPQPVPARGTCPILPLARGDYAYVRSITEKLGDALRSAAEAGDATYVDMVEASAGHDICAGSKAWVNGIQTDMARAVAFHPFAEEQQAVADLILAELEP